MNPVDQLNSYQRIAQRRIAGYGTSPTDFVMNIDQAYKLFLNCFESVQRQEYWRCMHLLAIDLANATEGVCPEPPGDLYKQLESE